MELGLTILLVVVGLYAAFVTFVAFGFKKKVFDTRRSRQELINELQQLKTEVAELKKPNRTMWG